MVVKTVLKSPYQRILMLSKNSIRVKSQPRRTIKWRRLLVVILLLIGTGTLLTTVASMPMELLPIISTLITCRTPTTRTCPCIKTTLKCRYRKAWRPFLSILANLVRTPELWLLKMEMVQTSKESTEAFLCHQSPMQNNPTTPVLQRPTKRIIILIKEPVLISLRSTQEKHWRLAMIISICLISSHQLTLQELMAWTSY